MFPSDAKSPAIVARTPAVSVVMAAYNAQAFVAEALDSVLGQTLGDFELLVVDDASTDGTPVILERYARRDRRIRILRLAKNAGTARARNAALREARAPFVAVCDDDDRQRPERLAAQVAYLEAHPGHVMVGGRVRPFGDADGAPPAWLPGDDALARPHVLFQALCIESANLYRRDLACVHGLRYPDGLLWDDWVFQALALRVGDIHVLPDILLDYRRHAAQQTSLARLAASSRRTRATFRRVFDIAGVTCSRAELDLHHAISPNPFGLLPDRDTLLRHGDVLEAEAGAWIERLGRRAVDAGWTDAAAFAQMAAEILSRLPQLVELAQAGPCQPLLAVSARPAAPPPRPR